MICNFLLIQPIQKTLYPANTSMDNPIVQTLDIRLKDCLTALEYLDNSGNLEILKAQCKKYLKVKV